MVATCRKLRLALASLRPLTCFTSSRPRPMARLTLTRRLHCRRRRRRRLQRPSHQLAARFAAPYATLAPQTASRQHTWRKPEKGDGLLHCQIQHTRARGARLRPLTLWPPRLRSAAIAPRCAWRLLLMPTSAARCAPGADPELPPRAAHCTLTPPLTLLAFPTLCRCPSAEAAWVALGSLERGLCGCSSIASCSGCGTVLAISREWCICLWFASRGKQGGVDDRLTLVRVRVRVRTLVPWFSPTTKTATAQRVFSSVSV